MKYFKVTNATDEKVVGKAKFPQCEAIGSTDDLTNEELPDKAPNLIFKLKDKACLTDVVSQARITARGFLVNEKVKNLLSDFNLMEHKFYPAKLIAKGEESLYHWLHFTDEEKYLQYIDYQNSTFHKSNLAFMKIDSIYVSSYQDFWDKKMNLPMKHIRAEKITLLPELRKQGLDLFYIPYIHSDYWISNRLEEVLETHKISGLQTKEQSIL
jgi:hypothetical protein